MVNIPTFFSTYWNGEIGGWFIVVLACFTHICQIWINLGDLLRDIYYSDDPPCHTSHNSSGNPSKWSGMSLWVPQKWQIAWGGCFLGPCHFRKHPFARIVKPIKLSMESIVSSPVSFHDGNYGIVWHCNHSPWPHDWTRICFCMFDPPAHKHGNGRSRIFLFQNPMCFFHDHHCCWLTLQWTKTNIAVENNPFINDLPLTMVNFP